ncbi:uncharacterized protein LOC134537105 [Bacillus rossius redtenbacheri]|uniref:uncharacterized protein LOC134537105 n=1 Tax=Bacillus rossius redtenbacheri TaxID=93214 RepID=UPI002FDE0DED
MNNKSPFSAPLGYGNTFSNGPNNQSRNISKSFEQFSPRNPSSPFSGSPRGRFENDFIPLGFSSPVNSHRNVNSTPPHWKVNRRFNNSNSYNSSSRNASPYNNSYRGNKSGKGGRDCNPGHAADISQYFHPSMLEDPWAELESRHGASVAGGSDSAKQHSAGSSLPLSDTDESADFREGEKLACSSDSS